MDLVQSVVPILDSFKAAFNSGDVQKAKSLLSSLKVKLTEFTSLPPFFEDTPTAPKELMIAREVLEHAVLLSVKLEDQAMFERQFAQLKTFYTDTRHLLPASQQEYPIMGLNFLRLLVQNRTAEFHTEMELLSQESLQNVYIKHAIALEQFLMEGAYNKVIAARRDVPAESYNYFMDLLMTTVRDEVAASCEKAYPTLSVASAKEMMSFDSESDLMEYAEERGWVVADGCLKFLVDVNQELTSKDIQSTHLINQMLSYAKELERIV
ncbi:hypothetical protein CYMTET_32642 [Cymbomonas tetramitiformis]|uniref:PCI domain-containing protein n=1 Tax=Cymbomonas tetramitiformis TaxID=36881 RepID=A0AAE0FEP4_9CHLO|nr:hypothetical protein CYMTET_32642 [Cymbomonas tetramitiformis]